MLENGGDLTVLKNQLKSAEWVGIKNPGSGGPDPYRRQLADTLIDVWRDIKGSLPGRVVDPYSGEEVGPFYDWVHEVIACCSVDGHKPVAADHFLRDRIKAAKAKENASDG